MDDIASPALLQNFLAEKELDNLPQLREALGKPDQAQSTIISEVLQSWSDKQAVANLLMSPRLIPAGERYGFIRQAFKESPQNYLTLAAIVGLSELDWNDFSEVAQDSLLQRLVEAVYHNTTPIAGRASSFLAGLVREYSDEVPAGLADSLAPLLDQPDAAVKHNGLVALIPLVGLTNLRAFIVKKIATGELSVQAQSYLEQKLAEVKGFFADNRVDIEKLNLGSLKSPLLSYIPNYEDWPANADQPH